MFANISFIEIQYEEHNPIIGVNKILFFAFHAILALSIEMMKYTSLS